MRRRLPTTQALIAFEAAARHLSFTKAGEELALTQSAICRQVAGLEAELGVALFRRTRRGVLLTEAGARYHRQVASRLDDMERDTQEMRAGQGRGMSLELAAVPTFATRWLVPRLARFQARHPEVTVHLSVRTRPFLFEGSGVDAAISACMAPWPGVGHMRLFGERCVAVASPALLGGTAPWPAERLVTLPLLQQSTRPDAWRAWCAAAGVAAEHARRGPRYELFSMLAEAAIQGAGVALIPAFLVARELARGELVVASAPVLDEGRAYMLLWPEGHGEAGALACFRAWLAGMAEEAMAEGASR